jgi:hypothetical protein
MRNAINNNPKVQLGVLAGLVVIAALVLLPSMMGGKSSSGGATNTVSAQATAPNGQSVNVTVESTQPPGSTSAAPTSGATPPPTTVDPQALVPGPGLPRPVIDAWKDGKTVVLLIVRNHGIDDKLVSRSVHALSVDSNLAIFSAHANRVARYSRITQGVGLSQVPALLIIRPKRVSGSVPEAQVAYGFRDSQTVVQYVHDALYSGKDDLPYSPR